MGNGWYEPDYGFISWQMPHGRLIQQPAIWDRLKSLNPAFRCALIGWEHYVQPNCDIVVGCRPGRWALWPVVPQFYIKPQKLFHQMCAEWEELKDIFFHKEKAMPSRLLDIDAEISQVNQWILRIAQWIEQHEKPHLTLVSLPALAYQMPRKGLQQEAIARELQEIDAIFGQLMELYTDAQVQVIVISDSVYHSVNQPVYINRILREEGLLEVMHQFGQEFLDVWESKAFVVTDQQLAHVYVRDRQVLRKLKDLCREIDGVAEIWDRTHKRSHYFSHLRTGDLVLLAAPHYWFAYDYWIDQQAAPFMHYAIAHANSVPETAKPYYFSKPATANEHKALHGEEQHAFHTSSSLQAAAGSFLGAPPTHAPFIAAQIPLPEAISPVEVYRYILQACKA
ncbi:MAG: alkaline phosphatase family protein [Thermoflavifilum sp.]|nr:alkaline phosphatase family protein [Thermoflavifilum sp.]